MPSLKRCMKQSTATGMFQKSVMRSRSPIPSVAPSSRSSGITTRSSSTPRRRSEKTRQAADLPLPAARRFIPTDLPIRMHNSTWEFVWEVQSIIDKVLHMNTRRPGILQKNHQWWLTGATFKFRYSVVSDHVPQVEVVHKFTL